MTQVYMPGGNLIVATGSYMRVRQFGTDPEAAPASGVSDVPFDVGKWNVVNILRETEVTHSGCMGAPARRRVLEDYQFRCDICYDKDSPPPVILGSASSVGLTFFLGDPTPYIGSGGSYATAPRYVSPSGLVTSCFTIADSTGTDIIRTIIEGKANSLMFLLPDAAVAYAAYIAALKAKGWLA